ncbi:MAG: hypothetical protein ACRDHP_12925 [Ktedonobacterales bacterium]
MRQFDTLRKRYDPRGQWFQIGLASATLLTPLLKRWNDLRAAEQARAWRDEAEARLREVRSWNPLRLTTSRRQTQKALDQVAPPRGNVSATIWLAGVSVGLVAAGAGAFVLVRRRMRQEQEAPLLDLPVPLNGNGGGGRNGAHLRAAAHAVAQGISRRDESAAQTQTASNGATPPPAPLRPGPQSPRLVPAVPASAPMLPPTPPQLAHAQTGPLMPPAPAEAASAPTASARQPDTYNTANLSGSATAPAGGAPAGVADANNAAFIGNIHTMVFHEADAGDLPAKGNRIYFGSEEEARDAGFRRARDEVSSGGE